MSQTSRTVMDYSLPRAKRTKWLLDIAPVTRKQTRTVGGYMSGSCLRGDTATVDGPAISLRIQDANKHLPSRTTLGRTRGYFTDDNMDDTLSPVVALLPHARGFLAGHTMGSGMWTVLDTSHIYSIARDAACAAHSFAEHEAASERTENARRNALVTCPTCDGHGYVSAEGQDCPTCDRRGTVTVWEMEDFA